MELPKQQANIIIPIVGLARIQIGPAIRFCVAALATFAVNLVDYARVNIAGIQKLIDPIRNDKQSHTAFAALIGRSVLSTVATVTSSKLRHENCYRLYAWPVDNTCYVICTESVVYVYHVCVVTNIEYVEFLEWCTGMQWGQPNDRPSLTASSSHVEWAESKNTWPPYVTQIALPACRSGPVQSRPGHVSCFRV